MRGLGVLLLAAALGLIAALWTWTLPGDPASHPERAAELLRRRLLRRGLSCRRRAVVGVLLQPLRHVFQRQQGGWGGGCRRGGRHGRGPS